MYDIRHPCGEICDGVLKEEYTHEQPAHNNNQGRLVSLCILLGLHSLSDCGGGQGTLFSCTSRMVCVDLLFT